MAFDKKYYQEVKKFTLHYLSHRPFFESYQGTPESHIRFVLSQIPHFIKNEDFEGAKALKDAIVEFYNSFYGQKLSKKVLLDIPEYKELELPPHHITYANPDNPAGLW